jgi:uncharacterized protein YjiS (DUF1127 family)
MAYAHRTEHAALGRHDDGLWAGLSARLARYRNYRRTLNELAALSDRDLTDMGIHRSNIQDIAREASSRG